jgi:signal transduction histidine kinase
MTLSGIVVAALYWNQVQSEQTLLHEKEDQHVRRQQEAIVDDFEQPVADLRTLAASGTLQALIEGDTPELRQALAEEFSGVLRHKQKYDHVRFIDQEGMEIVRVNYLDGETVVVPREQLQVKKDRYYFAKTINLKRGQVYVSPLDLNIEQGEIEQPRKPTIRFGVPMFNARNERLGILVLNYLGAKLLEKLPRNALGAAGQPLLVNSQGYYLAGHSPSEEWGFMFPALKDRSLAVESPEAWKIVSEAPSGQFRTAHGIYTFRTVYPLLGLRGAAKDAASSEATPLVHHVEPQEPYFWKVISHVRPERLQELSHSFWTNFMRVWLGLGVLFAGAAWLVAWLSMQNKWPRQRLLKRERLAAIGEAMTALAHESRNALQRSQAGLEMVKKRVRDDADSLELLAEVHDAQRYLTDLYEEVRGYAAPIQLRRSVSDLGQLVHTTWGHLATEKNHAQAQLILDESPLNLQCEVDPRAVGQVLRNVLENALAASDHPEIRVHFAEDTLHNRPALRISVRDNGRGFRPQDKERVFEPFFTTKLRGTGLGLAISRRIIEAHGGRIGVGDPPGPGAEILITLPRRAS